MCAGVPVENFYAAGLRRRDRIARDRVVYRVRALRGPSARPGSVEHGDFPPQKVHPVDRELLPSPEQVMLLCKARRSNRAFTAKPVPEETLDRILEAAHRAPTASNLQRVAFTLVTDPEKLHAISAFTVGVFASILRKLENPLLKPVLKRIAPQLYGYVPHFKRLISEFDKGNDLILRGLPP